MIRSVALLITCCVRGKATRSSNGTGGPASIRMCLRGNGLGVFVFGGSSRCAPHWPTGITGAPVSRAIRAAPDFPVISRRSGSRVSVPSG